MSALGALGAMTFSRALAAAPVRPQPSDRPDLQVALRAERWIRGTRIVSPHGVTWPADPSDASSARGNLYQGASGVVIFLLELHAATGDPRFLAEAVAGADHLLATHRDPAAELDSGLYTGLAGVAFALHETARASGEARHREGADLLARRLVAAARSEGAGVAWNDVADVIAGSAGIGLFLLQRHRKGGDPTALDAAVGAGDRLLEIGLPERGGTKWAMSPRVQTLYPNFSHGTAGVAYFLASLHQATGEPRFLSGALAGARYLLAVAETRDGFRVFHHEPGGGDLFYLSWCHGPPGTARLFQRLAETTRDPAWSELVHACARSVLASGIPERRTPGFWNNVSQCCGDAGVGEFFLSLHRLRPEPGYLEMARRSAADILRRASEEADTLRWVQAEHRVRPDLLVAQTGLMQGAAGVGLFFLRLDALESGRVTAIRLPDSPFA